MGRVRLAAAIASRWRVPEESILQRLEAGRVRVKSKLSEPEARQVAGDLVGLGAIVSVVDSQTGAPLALAAPAAPAFSGAAPAFELQNVEEDEAETQAPSAKGTMYNPDDPGAPSLAPALAAAVPDPSSHAPASPATLAPPNLMPPAPRPSAPMAAVPVRVSASVSVQTPAVRRPPPGANMLQAFFFERPRTRILAGAGISLLLGLIASAIYVSQVRHSSYQAIVDELVEYQSKELSLSQWQTDLPEVRGETVQALRSRRTTMVVGSMLIWLCVGGAFSFAWFRYLS